MRWGPFWLATAFVGVWALLRPVDAWAFYGLLTVALLHYTRRRGETFGAAVVLAVGWLLCNLSHWFVEPYSSYLTLIDYALGLGFVWWWRRGGEPWKLVVGLLIVAQWPFDWMYVLNGDNSHRARFVYDLTLNLIYLAQLATVAVAARPLRRFG